MSISTPEFAHLHLHSEYSLLDGACRFDTLFDRVKELGMKSVALTDHGNLFGAYDFYKGAKAAGVKPIIGCEVYLAPGGRFEKKGLEDRSNQHFVLLAESTEGYFSLAKLCSLAYAEGFYYKPRIDIELLEKHHKGIVGLSACLKGPISEALLDGDEKKANEMCDTFAQILGPDNFHLELMDHGMDEQKKVNEGILKMAKRTGLPLVATNDCHYLKADDHEIQDVLMCISMNKNIAETNRLKLGDQLFMKSPQQMDALFGHIPGALQNTVALSERLNPSIPTNQKLYPAFKPENGMTDTQYLRELTERGMRKRFPNGFPDEAVYRARIEYELGVIEKMGFNSYYLVVWDFIRYAREQRIPVGPGRGSGAASLVAFALEITDLDPIHHNLVFERFLNPERVDPPDFDIDFCFERRGAVIEYVKKKYGPNNVAQIVTFGTLKAKNAVRDVGRVMGMGLNDVDRIAKLIPETLGVTLDQALEQVAELKSAYDSDATIHRLIDYARRVEGAVRHSSIHAAGVVIADQELSDLTPIFRPAPQQEDIATQFAMKQVTALGLLKMDFLGLKNLTVIDRAERMIHAIRGVTIDWMTIPDNDPPTYKMLQKGDAFGVFQLESSGMRDLLRKLKPETFAEITALIALYRPGPMQNIDEFIDRKHGRVRVSYDHPLLEPILKETFGLIVYQEQVQQIANVLAGYSLGQADLLRRAMGKKIKSEMESQRVVFIGGAVERGVDRPVAEKIFALMEKFAEYGFNKAHSAAYAVITFRTGYLKAHFPVEYMAALLTNEIGATNDKLGLYISIAREMGIKVLPPDINESGAEFTPVGQDIRFGLAAIKNVGGGVVDEIAAERGRAGRFASLQDFCRRVNHKAMNSRMVECLIRAGALDSLGATRPQMLKIAPECLELGNLAKREEAAGQGSLFDSLGDDIDASMREIAMPNVPDWSDREKLQSEKELLGFYVSGHPLDPYEVDFRSFGSTNSTDLKLAKDQAEATAIGVIVKVQTKADRKGATMAFVELADFEGSFEIVVFSRTYEANRNLLNPEAVVWVKGRVSETNGERKMLADDFKPIEELRADRAKIVELEIESEGLDKQWLENLKQVFENHKGRCPLRLSIKAGAEGESIMLSAGKTYKLKPSLELAKDLDRLGLKRGMRYGSA